MCRDNIRRFSHGELMHKALLVGASPVFASVYRLQILEWGHQLTGCPLDVRQILPSVSVTTTG